MSLHDLLNKTMGSWLAEEGPYSDIVISSRLRLARNLKGYPFPHLASVKSAAEVMELVKKAVNIGNKRDGLQFIDLSELRKLDRQILVEKHLMSPLHAEEGQHKGLIVNEDETVSIMINEEDHLRIQCIYPGLQLQEVWLLADQIDNMLEEKLEYGFCEQRGYLTSCPTNTGTGMRASVMIHLPALVITNQANSVLTALSQLGLAVRGLYGEGTEALGNLFQISNQITLGQTEDEIISNLTVVTKQLIDQEKAARELLLKEAKDQLLDRVFRAYGLLSNAHIMSSREALSLLSDVRLGVDLKLITNIKRKVLNELLIIIGPAFLQRLSGHEMTPMTRDTTRADLIKKRLIGK